VKDGFPGTSDVNAARQEEVDDPEVREQQPGQRRPLRGLCLRAGVRNAYSCEANNRGQESGTRPQTSIAVREAAGLPNKRKDKELTGSVLRILVSSDANEVRLSGSREPLDANASADSRAALGSAGRPKGSSA